MWPARLYRIFPHCLINRTTFGKKVVEHKMCVWIFSTTFVWNIFHSKKNWTRYNQKCLLLFLWRVLYSCQILMKLDFSRHIIEKYSNIKFHENRWSGSRCVAHGQTDTTKLMVAYRNFTVAPNKCQNKSENSYLIPWQTPSALPLYMHSCCCPPHERI